MPQKENEKSNFFQKLANNKGAFSPFMFGMLMGVTAFSTMMRYQAEKELKNIEKTRHQTEQKQTEDIKRALENAILTENVNDRGFSYSTDLDMARAQSFLSESVGKTRSGQNVVLKSRKSGETLGADNQRIAITASEDDFLREKVESLGSSDAIDQLEVSDDQSLAIFDSSTVRTQQVKQSKEYLRMEEAQLYRYWGSNNYTFPSGQADYEDNVNAYTGLRDVWGQKFKYTRISDNRCKIGFTTPWGYETTIVLDME